MKIFTKLFLIAALAVSFGAQAAEGYQPVSIDPADGTLEDGQTVVLTFDQYIDWFMRVNEYNNGVLFLPLDGSIAEPVQVAEYQGVQVNAKTIKVKLQKPEGYADVTAWELLIPANTIVNSRTNEGNGEIRVKYDGEGGGGEQPKPQYFSFTGASVEPGVIEAPFAGVSLTFDAADVTIDVEKSVTVAFSKNVEPISADETVEGTQLRINIEPQEAPGTYTVTVPGGFLVAADGSVNAEWVGSYTIQAPAQDLLPVTVEPDPAEKELLPLNRIAITFPDCFEDVEVYPFFIWFKEADGKSVNFQLYTLGNLVVFDEFEITEPGEYTMTFEAGSFVSAGSTSPAFELKWNVVEEDGILTIQADESTPARYFDLQGRPVTSPASGLPVIRVSGNNAVKVIF